MALVTIKRCMCLTLQSRRRNSTANQSNNSPWMGNSLCIPKSSDVLTNPVPKKFCHIRLTRTRAVKGFSSATSQRANPRRLLGKDSSIAGSQFGVPAESISPAIFYDGLRIHDRTAKSKRANQKVKAFIDKISGPYIGSLELAACCQGLLCLVAG